MNPVRDNISIKSKAMFNISHKKSLAAHVVYSRSSKDDLSLTG
ncbi:MAG: hypothetical protein Q8Q17_01840 [bacterium]|nr:hypothetical protein [bacterium]